ncbi:2458_t:CDS:1, partial [Scutellospora calospora]
EVKETNNANNVDETNESLSKFYIDILTGAINPERNVKTTNLWDFLRSYIGEKGDQYFLKAMENYYYKDTGKLAIDEEIKVANMEIKLSLSPKYYNWVLLNFKPYLKIVSESFKDILATRVSIDIKLQEDNNIANETTTMICDTFKTYCLTYCYTEGFFLPSQLKIICKTTSEDILNPLFKCYLYMVFEIKPQEVTDYMDPNDSFKVENATLLHNELQENLYIHSDSLNVMKANSQCETAPITEDITFEKCKTKKELQEQWYKEIKKYHNRIPIAQNNLSKFDLYMKEFWQIFVETEIGRELREKEKDIEKSSNPR